MKENLEPIISKAMVGISGWMDENTKDFGKITRCMGKGLSYGLMVANTREST